ncbi:hypothetical protein D3C80_1398410 [compost metagenome]
MLDLALLQARQPLLQAHAEQAVATLADEVVARACQQLAGLVAGRHDAPVHAQRQQALPR